MEIYNFKIHKNLIITHKNNYVDNREYKFVNSIDETNLVKKQLNEEIYICIVQYDNIGHFFHDHFFLFYSIWREKKRKVLVYLNNSFYLDFIISTLGSEYVEKMSEEYLYFGERILLTPEHRKRDLTKIKNYKLLLKEIKEKCFKYNNIIEDRHLNVLYGRQDLNRKVLLNIDIENLQKNNIKVIDNLSQYTFKETIDLLSKCKNFIFAFGAGVTYEIFLQNVLEIHPNLNDSWSLKFGLCNICNLNIYVSRNTTPSIIKKGQSNKRLDDNIYYDNDLHKSIIKFTSENKLQ